jgi:outer membrane lipoprotein-sorting protein
MHRLESIAFSIIGFLLISALVVLLTSCEKENPVPLDNDPVPVGKVMNWKIAPLQSPSYYKVKIFINGVVQSESQEGVLTIQQGDEFRMEVKRTSQWVNNSYVVRVYVEGEEVYSSSNCIHLTCNYTHTFE